MICGKCGQFNEEGQNFCRFCGAAMLQNQTKTPRPYGWASPSSPLHDVAGFGEPQQVQPLVQTPPPVPQSQLSGYHCPRCGTTAPPQIRRKISDGGWIVFVLMLLFCFPLFWIGFLIKEEERVCSMCFARLG
jgi:lipopolysaccharide-induced tumor necrosis factor-alpha factor